MASSKSSAKADNSQTTTNTTTYTDNRIAAGEGADVVQQGGTLIGDGAIYATDNSTINAQIQTTDFGAIDRAFDSIDRSLSTVDTALASNTSVSMSALAGMKSASDNSAILAQSALAGASDFAGALLEKSAGDQRAVLAFTDAAIARAGTMFESATESDSMRFTELLTKLGTWAALAAGTFGIIYLFKKK